MRSESKKSFKHGFELTEQELRRIFDVLTQQISRTAQSLTPKSSFELKFRNGVIAEPSSLDEILSLENIGSGAIVRLQIKIDDGLEKPTSLIKLEFTNAANDSDSEDKAISYTITGDDRDWVFVTSSQLEERIAKIKQANIGRYLKSKDALFFLQFIILIPMTIFVFSLSDNSSKTLKQGIGVIETNWKNGTLKDTVDVILALERLKTESHGFDFFANNGILLPIVIGVAVLILFFTAIFGWSYYFPAYNFMWGDNIRFIQKRKNTGNFIFGGIILAIVISVLANYITSLLGIGK